MSRNAARLAPAFALALTALAAAGPARAAARWFGGFDSYDLRNWYQVQCGGTDGSCPCTGNYYNPTWQTAYGSGSCATTNSNSPLAVAPANGRFQIVTNPPGAEFIGEALRVELRQGDLWPCASGCGTPTTRNEVLQTKDTGTTLPTEYRAGDERWFAWSTYFDPGFATWSCNDQTDATRSSSNCPNGVPNSSFNPWNVVFQFHHSGNTGVPPLAMALRRSQVAAGQPAARTYALTLIGATNNGNADSELWRQNVLATGRWYDFVLHVRFGDSRKGLVEFYVGMDGGPKQKQTLRCADGSSSTLCKALTSYRGTVNYLKQGLYRNSSITDTSLVFHKGSMDGDTLADVTADFSIAVAPQTAMPVLAGGAAVYTVTTAPVAGEARAVKLGTVGLPADATAVFDPPVVTAGGSSTLTVTLPSTAAAASYSFAVGGQYPSASPAHAADASLTVQ